MTGAPKAVFLSYASQDAEAAGRICAALRHAGVEVWFDQSELRGGDAWDQKIRREIHDCSLFVPIVSHHTQDRLEGYFRLEWKLAVDRSHTMAIERPFLVPVVVDSTTDQEAIVPDSFRAVQWTRLPRGETPPEFVTRITRLLSSDHSIPELDRPAPRIEPVVSSGTIANQFIARRPVALWLPLGLAIAAIGHCRISSDRTHPISWDGDHLIS
jgi:hypothetical protein